MHAAAREFLRGRPARCRRWPERAQATTPSRGRRPATRLSPSRTVLSTRLFGTARPVLVQPSDGAIYCQVAIGRDKLVSSRPARRRLFAVSPSTGVEVGLRLHESPDLDLDARPTATGAGTLAASERCPSGLRSATGNRVRAERCVAGSNPALSVADTSGTRFRTCPYSGEWPSRRSSSSRSGRAP
jgi:hypothetical protein